MKNLTQLTQLELVLLELVAKGQGKWSCTNSRMHFPVEMYRENLT